MTQFDIKIIQGILERPFSADESDMPQQPTGVMSGMSGNDLRDANQMNSGDLLGSAQDEDEDFMGDLEKPH